MQIPIPNHCVPHSQCKQVESKIQITSVKFVSALTLSYWQSSSLLLTFHCNTLLKQNDVFACETESEMISKKLLSCGGSENKQNNKILENGKLPVMRDFVSAKA